MLVVVGDLSGTPDMEKIPLGLIEVINVFWCSPSLDFIRPYNQQLFISSLSIPSQQIPLNVAHSASNERDDCSLTIRCE